MMEKMMDPNIHVVDYYTINCAIPSITTIELVTKSILASLPVDHTKLLGVIIDDKLSFSQHREFLVTKSNSSLFLMQKLKALGLMLPVSRLFMNLIFAQF